MPLVKSSAKKDVSFCKDEECVQYNMHKDTLFLKSNYGITLKSSLHISEAAVSLPMKDQEPIDAFLFLGLQTGLSR